MPTRVTWRSRIPEQFVSLKLQVFTMLKFLRRKNDESSKHVRRRKSLDFEITRGPLSPSLVVFEEKETGGNSDAVDGSGNDTEKKTEASDDVLETPDAAVVEVSSAPPSPLNDEQVVFDLFFLSFFFFLFLIPF